MAGTPFDFRKPTVIGARIRDGRDEQIVRARGYDHNWVVTDAPTAEPHLVARVEDPESGRILEVASNQPGVQFYAGNFLNATVVGKSGLAYRSRTPWRWSRNSSPTRRTSRPSAPPGSTPARPTGT